MVFRAAALVLIASFRLAAAEPPKVLWRDPGPVGKLDFAGALGAPVQAPKAPYQFIREDLSGTQPKVVVKDANGTEWNVKFGYEVKPEAFSWRFAKAAGYYAEPCFFVATGQILSLPKLKRSSQSLQPDGKFTSARFQWRDKTYQFLESQNWSWTRNPFLHSKELAGLKIVLMLSSNFDNKDGSDTFGPNTGIFLHHPENGREEWVYTFTDWGSSMGFWGAKTGQTDWRCEDYTKQTPEFVQGVSNGEVKFGYAGIHTDDFKRDIHPADVAWLMRYLGQITDEQLRAALRSSGATPQEETCFTAAIRARLEQLKKIGEAGTKPAPPIRH